LAQHPFIGRERRDLSPPGIRSWRVSGFPRWLLFYTVDQHNNNMMCKWCFASLILQFTPATRAAPASRLHALVVPSGFGFGRGRLWRKLRQNCLTIAHEVQNLAKEFFLCDFCASLRSFPDFCFPLSAFCFS
jgi:hypothetical protein